jgi:hypothetical protein
MYEVELEKLEIYINRVDILLFKNRGYVIAFKYLSIVKHQLGLVKKIITNQDTEKCKKIKAIEIMDKLCSAIDRKFIK